MEFRVGVGEWRVRGQGQELGVRSQCAGVRSQGLVIKVNSDGEVCHACKLGLMRCVEKRKTRKSPSSALEVVAKAGIEPATHGFSVRCGIA